MFDWLIAEDESISSLPLGIHCAVAMLYDSVLYKSIIDIDVAVLGFYALAAESGTGKKPFYPRILCLYKFLMQARSDVIGYWTSVNMNIQYALF